MWAARNGTAIALLARLRPSPSVPDTPVSPPDLDLPARQPLPAGGGSFAPERPAVDLRLWTGDRQRVMTSAAKPSTRKRPSYNSTEVSATTSREEIQKLLDRADLGITDVRWVALGGPNSRLLFRIDGRLYQIDIHASDAQKDPSKKFRRLHRGVAHLLKNAIAVAEEGLCGVGEILAAFLLTSEDNVTVGEALLRLEAGSARPFMLALAPAETALVPTTPTGMTPANKPRER